MLAPRYKERTGGYTRVMRMGYRDNDKSELGIIELVDSPFELGKALNKFEEEAKKRGKFSRSVITSKKYLVAKQTVADKIKMPNANFQKLREERSDYIEKRINQLLMRDIKPKFKEGWSIPLKRPSFIDRILQKSGNTCATVKNATDSSNDLS